MSRSPFAEAREQAYTPFRLGTRWGRPWGTTWFHITGSVPADWSDQPGTAVELVVDLGFGSDLPGFVAEGLAYAADGTVVKGIEPRNAYVPLVDSEPVDLYLEAAANPNVGGDWTFTPTHLGDLATAGTDPLYQLRQLELGLLDTVRLGAGAGSVHPGRPGQ